jgi:hypothetical protein
MLNKLLTVRKGYFLIYSLSLSVLLKIIYIETQDTFRSSNEDISCPRRAPFIKTQVSYYNLTHNKRYHYEFRYELNRYTEENEHRLLIILVGVSRRCIDYWTFSAMYRTLSIMRTSGYSILTICSEWKSYDTYRQLDDSIMYPGIPDKHLQSHLYLLVNNTKLCYTMFTLDEIHSTLLHTLFMNTMSLNNACATISGLFNYGLAKQWIVTRKFGCGSQDISQSIEKELSILKRNKNALYERKINKSYSYHLSFIINLISDRCQWTYQRIHQNLRSFRFYKRNFSMAVYLLVNSYLAFEKRAYVTGIYMFSTSIMCFILAFDCIGRRIT